MPDKPGLEASFLPYVRAWVANLVLASVDYGVSLSCGGVVLLVALYFNAPSPHWWFIGGAALPLGPLGILATSKKAFRDELKLLRDLHDQKLITTAEYDAQRARVLTARADRLHGNIPALEASPKPSTTEELPKPRKASKPARTASKPEGEASSPEPSPIAE